MRKTLLADQSVSGGRKEEQREGGMSDIITL